MDLVLAKRLPQTPGEWMVLGAIVAAVAAGYGCMSLWHRARRKRLIAAAERMGLAAVDLKSPEAEYCHRAENGQRSFELKVCAVGVIGGRAARLAEFTYVTGHGKSSRTWTNTQISVECPVEWPAMAVEEAAGFMSRPISQLFKDREGPIEDAAFNKRWEVVCEDAAFARGFLADGVREFLLKGPSCERWLIGDGWTTCTWRKACAEGDLKLIAERVGKFLAATGAGA